MASIVTNKKAESFSLSYKLEQVQNYSGAIKAISPLAYDDDYVVNLRLGYLYYLSGKYANAVKHYRLSHRLFPSAITPLLGLMNISIARKRYSEIEKYGYQIIKNDRHNYYANLKLNYAYLMQEKYDIAKENITKMLILYPEDVSTLLQLARYYIAKKNFQKMKNIYSKVLLLDPLNLEAKYYYNYKSAQTLKAKAHE